MGIQRDKLERSLGGIANMKKVTDMIFIIDTNVESLAVKEAQKLNIPIVAIVDTNSDPTGINFPIPGNDDARRAINLYFELIEETVLDAQKNISNKDSEQIDDKKDKEQEIKKTSNTKKVEKSKKINSEKKETIKKKAASVISKIKKLTSKNK